MVQQINDLFGKDRKGPLFSMIRGTWSGKGQQFSDIGAALYSGKILAGSSLWVKLKKARKFMMDQGIRHINIRMILFQYLQKFTDEWEVYTEYPVQILVGNRHMSLLNIFTDLVLVRIVEKFFWSYTNLSADKVLSQLFPKKRKDVQPKQSEKSYEMTWKTKKDLKNVDTSERHNNLSDRNKIDCNIVDMVEKEEDEEFEKKHIHDVEEMLVRYASLLNSRLNHRADVTTYLSDVKLAAEGYGAKKKEVDMLEDRLKHLGDDLRAANQEKDELNQQLLAIEQKCKNNDNAFRVMKIDQNEALSNLEHIQRQFSVDKAKYKYLLGQIKDKNETREKVNKDAHELDQELRYRFTNMMKFDETPAAMVYATQFMEIKKDYMAEKLLVDEQLMNQVIGSTQEPKPVQVQSDAKKTECTEIWE